MARLKILSADDLDNLYSIPKLDEDDQSFAFDLDETDHNNIQDLGLACKIDYILQLTYFRLTQYFFSFTFQGRRSDVWYTIKTYFPDAKFPKKSVNKNQHYHNRNMILKKYDMTNFTSKFKSKLITYAKQLATQHLAPKYIFDTLLNYCHQNKIVRPGYSLLQEVVSEALELEKVRLSKRLSARLDADLIEGLNMLLEKDDKFYHLTTIKKDQKDFTTSEIKATVNKNETIASIYHRTTEIINSLGLSEQNAMYYADLASYYTVYGLKNMKNKSLARLYMICYVRFRFLKINDFLVSSFSHKVNHYQNLSEEYQKIQYDKHLEAKTKIEKMLLIFCRLLKIKKLLTIKYELKHTKLHLKLVLQI